MRRSEGAQTPLFLIDQTLNNSFINSVVLLTMYCPIQKAEIIVVVMVFEVINCENK